MKRFTLTVLFMVAFMLGVSAPSVAAPITGTIAFGGTGTPIGDPTDWYSATGVEFGNWFVLDGTGDYSSVPIPTAATFEDVTWGNDSGAVNNPLAQIIWSFTVGSITYSMTAGAVTDIDRGSAVNDNISVNGTGTLLITGLGLDFEPTPGDWNFTAGFAGSAANLSFSAEPLVDVTDDASVPEPATLTVFCTALLAVTAGLRRRSRKSAR